MPAQLRPLNPVRALLLASTLLFASAIFANDPYLNPGLTVSPKLPSSTDLVIFDISDNTGVYANVLDSSITRTGVDIEVRASIELGYTSILSFYHLRKTLQSLPSGMYTLSYVARTKRKDPDTPLTEYFTEAQWRFAVLDAPQVIVAVEYFHQAFNHYFLTTSPDEMAALDSGYFSGWARTGETIPVVDGRIAIAGLAPVCRFYGRPDAGLDTHVYTANETECGILANLPQSWTYESPSAFAVGPIDTTNGACPSNMKPVYRLWNGLPSANHRYTTSKTVQAEMVAAGWIPEGSGSPPAIWCAPPASE